jgi:DivIVA domain-containing protein
VLQPEFTVRRTGDRYDRADVDALVERILATVGRRAGDVTIADLRGAAFRTPMLGAGYSSEEVDTFLAEAERWLPDSRPQASHLQDSPMPDRPMSGQVPAGEQRQRPRFSTVRLRMGYDAEQVDEFIDRVMATVNGQPVQRPVTADEIRNIAFSSVWMREGYDVAQVDMFLDQAEDWLRDS